MLSSPERNAQRDPRLNDPEKNHACHWKRKRAFLLRGNQLSTGAYAVHVLPGHHRNVWSIEPIFSIFIFVNGHPAGIYTRPVYGEIDLITGIRLTYANYFTVWVFYDTTFGQGHCGFKFKFSIRTTAACRWGSRQRGAPALCKLIIIASSLLLGGCFGSCFGLLIPFPNEVIPFCFTHRRDLF